MTQELVADEIRAKVSAPDTRPEVELLLYCVRTCMDSETAERITNLLDKDIDWDYLIQIALWHRVMPLLYWNLKATCPEAVPKAILTQLRYYFHANAQHNLFLTGELLKLLNLLETHGISAIPFKGPVLTASTYGNLSLRQFSDLDILVHERDVRKTKNLLISQGYQLNLTDSTNPNPNPQEQTYLQSMTDAQEAVYLQHHWEYHLGRDDDGVNIDLHWGILPKHFSFRLDMECLWERLEQVSLTDMTVLNFSPEDLLLLLCMHGTKDCWNQLVRICDIAELIRTHQGINWGQLMEQASMLGSERSLFLGLYLARDFLGTTLPREVLQRMQAEPVVKSLAAQVREQLFCEVDRPFGNSKIESSLFYLRVRERWQDKVRCCLHWMIPTVAERVVLPLPPYLSFLYYLLRPIRLVRKYGLSFFS